MWLLWRWLGWLCSVEELSVTNKLSDETTSVSLRLRRSEIRAIDARAARLGVNRTDYLRHRILHTDQSDNGVVLTFAPQAISLSLLAILERLLDRLPDESVQDLLDITHQELARSHSQQSGERT